VAVAVRPATAADADAVTAVLRTSRAAALPWPETTDGGRNEQREPDVRYGWTG